MNRPGIHIIVDDTPILLHSEDVLQAEVRRGLEIDVKRRLPQFLASHAPEGTTHAYVTVHQEGMLDFRYDIVYGVADGNTFLPKRMGDEVVSELLPHPKGPDYQPITLVNGEQSLLYQ